MDALATADDYTELYGAVSADVKSRLDALISSASAVLYSYLDDYTAGEDEVFDLNLKSVCCAMVNRVVSAPSGLAGMSQFSQTAGSYTVSGTLLDQYMRLLPSEKELLGIGDGCIVVSARIGGTYD